MASVFPWVITLRPPNASSHPWGLDIDVSLDLHIESETMKKVLTCLVNLHPGIINAIDLKKKFF